MIHSFRFCKKNIGNVVPDHREDGGSNFIDFPKFCEGVREWVRGMAKGDQRLLSQTQCMLKGSGTNRPPTIKAISTITMAVFRDKDQSPVDAPNLSAPPMAIGTSNSPHNPAKNAAGHIHPHPSHLLCPIKWFLPRENGAFLKKPPVFPGFEPRTIISSWGALHHRACDLVSSTWFVRLFMS